jgi:hypothetical protein
LKTVISMNRTEINYLSWEYNKNPASGLIVFFVASPNFTNQNNKIYIYTYIYIYYYGEPLF